MFSARLAFPLTSFFPIVGWWQRFLVPCKALEIRYILMDCYLVDIHRLAKAFRGYRMENGGLATRRQPVRLGRGGRHEEGLV